jgi:hypothetical protein
MDLGIEAITPITKQVGDNLSVTVQIRNSGNVTYSFYVGVSVGTGTIFYDETIYNDNKGKWALVSNLAPGASATISRSMTLPTTGTIVPGPGQETFWDVRVAIRDPTNTNTVYALEPGSQALLLQRAAAPVPTAEIVSITLV